MKKSAMSDWQADPIRSHSAQYEVTFCSEIEITFSTIKLIKKVRAVNWRIKSAGRISIIVSVRRTH